MIHSEKIIIEHESGLHARPASIFTKEASKFESRITVKGKGKEADAKSIIGLLSLGIDKGAEILIHAEGNDAEQAVTALINLIKNEFQI